MHLLEQVVCQTAETYQLDESKALRGIVNIRSSGRLQPTHAKSSRQAGNYYLVTLFDVYANDVNLGHLGVPIARDGLEDKAKVSFVARLQGGRADRLSVDIGFSRPNQ